MAGVVLARQSLESDRGSNLSGGLRGGWPTHFRSVRGLPEEVWSAVSAGSRAIHVGTERKDLGANRTEGLPL